MQFESNLFFLTGLKNKRRITDIDLVAAEAYMTFNTTTIDKETFLHALLAYHFFTGCDSISAFCGRGKVKANY